VLLSGEGSSCYTHAGYPAITEISALFSVVVKNAHFLPSSSSLSFYLANFAAAIAILVAINEARLQMLTV
jgi:hypothetical protein